MIIYKIVLQYWTLYTRSSSLVDVSYDHPRMSQHKARHQMSGAFIDYPLLLSLFVLYSLPSSFDTTYTFNSSHLLLYDSISLIYCFCLSFNSITIAIVSLLNDVSIS